jgi:aryl-alcohol dehydrogenase-like predicted oxidoreductase
MSGNTSNSEMLYRVLGSTKEQVSAIGLGGWHIALKHVDEELGIRIVRTAIDRGITFMDNSWDYNGGESEIRMGKALRDGYRDKVFLMTKIDGRSNKEATRQIDESLQRLQVDCIDLVQHHEIIRYEDPHRVSMKTESLSLSKPHQFSTAPALNQIQIGWVRSQSASSN